MNDLVTTDSAESSSSTILQVIADAATNPDVDVNKMQALLDMQLKVMDVEAQRSFTKDMAKLQNEMPTIGKNGEILNKQGKVQSRYSSWDNLHRIINPLLLRHGFALMFRTGGQGNMLTVEAVLSHKDGHSESSGAMPLALDTSGSKNPTQGAGSSLSYGKRYTAIAILNIGITDDKDGLIAADMIKIAAPIDSDLEADATAAASCGMAAYESWFKDQTNINRAALVTSGKHDELKKAAAKADAGEQDADEPEPIDDDMFPGDLE